MLHSTHCADETRHRNDEDGRSTVNDQQSEFPADIPLDDADPAGGSAVDPAAPTTTRQHEGVGLGGAATTATPPSGSGPTGELISAERDVHLESQDVGDINAVQVRMDRSGAEHIDAQRVTMTNSGAKTMSVQSAQLDKSGVLVLKGERAVFQGSSSILARVQDLRLARSRVAIAQTGTTTIENDSRIGVLRSGSVVAGGDINSWFLFSGSVRADGDVNVTFDAASAAALGASLAAGLLLLRRVLGRN